MIKMYNSFSINIRRAKVRKRMMEHLKLRKEIRTYMIVWSYFPSQKPWLRIMNGIAQIVRISFWLRNKCISIQLLKYWFYAWKGLREKAISNRNITCNYLAYHRFVDFPLQGLDLTEYVISCDLPDSNSEANAEGKHILYDLFGISNHSGGTGGGHYTAYCKNPKTGKWYDFDDSFVQ